MLRAIFNRSEFVGALELVGTVIPKRGMPILECVRLEATGCLVRISGTDLETSLSVDFHQVHIEHKGVALLNLQDLLSSLKTSTADIVKLEPRQDDGVSLWRIADSDSEFTIEAAKPEEYPALPFSQITTPTSGKFVVHRDQLVKCLNHVVWSAGSLSPGGSARWRFDSLCFSIRKGSIELVATDSRTMAVADLGGMGEGHFGVKDVDGEGEFVVPIRIAKLLTAATRFAEDDADDLSAYFSIDPKTDVKKEESLTARFNIGTVSVSCVVANTEERRFPPYRETFTGLSDRIMLTASSEDFLSALKRCAVATDSQSSGVAVELDSKGACLTADSSGGRRSRVMFPCRVIGGGIRFGVNPNQLISAIKAAKSDEFMLAGSAPNRPWKVTNGNGYKAVLMPVNLGEPYVPATPKPAVSESSSQVPETPPAVTVQPAVPVVRSEVQVVQRAVPTEKPSETSQPITVAWRSLGHDVTQADSSAEAIQLAGLDWTVSQWPVSAIGPDGVGPIVAKHFVANVRQDTKSVLGIVGRKYKPFQNVEAFSFADAVVGEGLAKYETAGALREGRRVWMLLKLPTEVKAGPDDLIKPYLLVYNSFDGSSCLRALLTSVRVVCQNTLNLALAAGPGEGITIRHRGDLQGRVADARHTLGLVHQRLETFTQEVEVMRSVQIRSKTVLRYFEDLVPAVAADATERERNNRTRALERLQANLTSDLNTLSGMRGSVWAALNAATEFADHQRIFRGKTDLARRQSRLDSIWFGSSSEFKQLAYEKALALAERN